MVEHSKEFMEVISQHNEVQRAFEMEGVQGSFERIDFRQDKLFYVGVEL